jgi:hypothetical protein
MDESPIDELEQRGVRSGADRRTPAERRNARNRLLERYARLEGTATDRRRRERRNGERGSWLSFLWRRAKD